MALERPDRTERLAARGIEDATRAIALLEGLAGTPYARFPLRIAELRMSLSELHAVAGHVNDAVRHAVTSLEGYRRHHTPGDQYSDLRLARALSRYADVLAIADEERAVRARAEAVWLYRPHAGPDGDLWARRFRRGPTRWSTPTFERFCHIAYRLAGDLGPPSLGMAGEAMPALQDAAEGFAGLLFHGPTAGLIFADPTYRERFTHVGEALLQLADWSRAISAPWLERAYQTAEENLHAEPTRNHHDTIREIRSSLEETLNRLRRRVKRAKPDDRSPR
jgi:hypothetical protein